MSKQTQGTMLMVGALSSTVGAIAFVALMVLGGYAISPAVFLAILVAGAAAVVLMLGFHRKPIEPTQAYNREKAPSAPTAPSHAAPVSAAAPVAATPEAAPAAAAASTSDAGEDPGTRPEALSGPRDGGADDLKMIKGVGPKMEELCNSLGFYHFDQIANWTPSEVAWVDNNLEGFKGRVTRDDWVAQATLLSAGGETEFSKKVEDGNVY